MDNFCKFFDIVAVCLYAALTDELFSNRNSQRSDYQEKKNYIEKFQWDVNIQVVDV